MRFPLIDLDDRRDDTPYYTAAAAFFAGWLALAFPWLSGRVTIPWDAKAHFLPQIQFLAASLARGESPFWNPYVFSGHPQISDPQAMIFSPPFLLLALLNSAPSAWAMDATVFLSILAGGLALIVWFRDQGWHPAGAVIASLAFGFGAAMAWRIQHIGQVMSLIYLPITLMLLDRAMTRDSWRYGLAAGVAGACLVLGRDQVALLGVYLLVAYVITHLAMSNNPRDEFHRINLPLAAGTFAGLAIIAIPVLLTALAADDSNRPAIDFVGAGRGSLHPAHALTLFAPDIFGSSGRQADYWGPPSSTWPGTDLFLAQNMGQLYLGALPALLILIAAGSGALWRREIRFFAVALVVMTIYALGWYTPFFGLAHRVLPGIDLYRRPADAVFLMGFLGAILAGYGAHLLLSEDHGGITHRETKRGAMVAAAVTLAALAVCLVLAIRTGHLGMATRPLFAAAAIFALSAAIIADAMWLLPIRPLGACALMIGVTVADLAYSNGPGSATALPPSDYAMLDPSTKNETLEILKRKSAEGRSTTRRDRIEIVGLGFPWPNASMTHRLENTLGYNPLRLGLYSQATGAEDTVGLPEQRVFSPLFPSYKSKLADLLGLRYIVSRDPITKLDPSIRPGDLIPLAQTADGYMYENPRALPRVMFALSAAPADLDLILNTGTWPDEDLQKVVLLSPDDEKGSGLIATRGKGDAHLVSYANTEVVVEANSDRGGFVVLNDLWHPWWVATLDDSPEQILRANVLFRAVRVPPGRHTVKFTFAPVSSALRSLLTP